MIARSAEKISKFQSFLHTYIVLVSLAAAKGRCQLHKEVLRLVVVDLLAASLEA